MGHLQIVSIIWSLLFNANAFQVDLLCRSE